MVNVRIIDPLSSAPRAVSAAPAPQQEAQRRRRQRDGRWFGHRRGIPVAQLGDAEFIRAADKNIRKALAVERCEQPRSGIAFEVLRDRACQSPGVEELRGDRVEPELLRLCFESEYQGRLIER